MKHLISKRQSGGNMLHTNGVLWDPKTTAVRSTNTIPLQEKPIKFGYEDFVKAYEANPKEFWLKQRMINGKPVPYYTGNFSGKEVNLKSADMSKIMEYLKNTKFTQSLPMIGVVGTAAGMANDKRDWDKMTNRLLEALTKSTDNGLSISPTMWKAMGIN